MRSNCASAPSRERSRGIETELATVVELLARIGTPFARFGPPSQDSGNVSWGVDVHGPGSEELLPGSGDARRLFLKTAGDPADAAFLDHATRGRLLRRAARLLRMPHPALPRCFGVLEADDGPMLVLEWRAGRLLRVDAEVRDSADDAAVRLRCDAVAARRAVNDLLDVHATLAARGWVAGDLYDGSCLVDPDTGALTLIDVDLYRLGATRNRMGRMFGSSRFMAPEEFEYGARIDQRTAVFVLGRLVAHLLGSTACAAVRPLAELLARATTPEPGRRFADPIELNGAWRHVKEIL